MATKERIKEIVQETKNEQTALNQLKERLENAENELEQAKAEREKNYTLELDKKVKELESYIRNLGNYVSEKEEAFQKLKAAKIEEIFELYPRFAGEKWLGNEHAKELEKKSIDSLKELSATLDEYHKLAKTTSANAFEEITKNDDFLAVFRGEMLLHGHYTIDTAIPNDGRVQAIHDLEKKFR